MSSLYDWGKADQAARQAKDSKCEKSKDGKHKWERHGHWPSEWDECKKCHETIFWK